MVDNQFYEADCYIRGTNLVAKYNYWNGNKSEYTYYTQNAHGDVVNLTNADGEVTKKYTYDAFGVEKNIDDSDTNAFRYCGEYYDTETGTVYLRARYYNPATGRFISRDSYAGKLEDPLSLNLYTYCANNPIYYSDPTGHIAGVDDAIIAGAFIAASIVSLAATTLSQPAVQEGLSTTINKASYFVEDAVENTTSLLASALTTIGCGIAELTGISSAPVLSAPTGLMSEFSTTIDSEANPYLAPWLYASMGSQSIAKDDADAAEKDIDIPYWPIKKPVYFPEDPNDFQPIGLVPVYREGTKNGSMIQWVNPITGNIVFQWDSNINKSDGSHYHIKALDEGLPKKEHKHFYPGSLVPEPWASIYFYER